MMLRARCSVTCLRIIFSTFCLCMSFYTARVKTGRSDTWGLCPLYPSKRTSRPRFHILHVEFRPRIIRVNDKSNHGSRRNKFAQQLEALCHKDGREQGYTRDVAAWPIET